MNSWNPVVNMFNAIKSEYINKFGKDSDLHECVYIENNETGGKKYLTCLEKWCYKLDIDKYNQFINPLQFNQYNNMILIRYGKTDLDGLKGMWEDEYSIYRECRSLVLDIITGEIILCPFRKFFNINEVKENDTDLIGKEINEAIVFEITNKLDGSMQSARFYNGEIIMSGSMALDVNNSWRLKDGYTMLTDYHERMIKAFPNYTFIFEYISRADRHLVEYQNEGLYLIGIRNVLNGYELNYSGVHMIGSKYGVAMAEIEDISFIDMLNQMRTFKANEKEGWVLNIDGHKVKVKCDDYVKLHRILDKASSVNVIIESIADNKYDDLVSKIPNKFRDRVDEIAELIFKYKKCVTDKVKEYLSMADKSSKKNFMLWVDVNVENRLKGYVRAEYLSNEWNCLKKGLMGYRKFSEMYDNPLNYYLGGDRDE